MVYRESGGINSTQGEGESIVYRESWEMNSIQGEWGNE